MMLTRIWSVIVVVCGLAALAGCGTSTSVSSSGWTAKRESHEATQPQQQPKFTVTMQHINDDPAVRETRVTVRHVPEQGDAEVEYRAILDVPANAGSPSTGFFATGNGSPFVEVHAGRAYLWGIFPSGRTRRVVTATPGLRGGAAEAIPYRKLIIEIDGETHRFVNNGDETIFITPVSVPGDVANPPEYDIPSKHYRNVTESPQGDAARRSIVVGEKTSLEAELPEAQRVKQMVEKMEDKAKEIPDP